MKITEKLQFDRETLTAHGAITIVAFGDSVTHGAQAEGVIDFETVYHNRLKKMLAEVRTYTPINVINAGIGGITAMGSLDRMERDVFSHHPDLVILCFGLNDVNRPLEDYLLALDTMFKACREREVDAIFMTPNMLNTYVADDCPVKHLAYAAQTAEHQNSGRFDHYIHEAKRVAEENGIPVCDVYAKWKELSKTEDTTKLLANRINHPTAQMHALFAQSLFDMIMADATVNQADGNTMY